MRYAAQYAKENGYDGFTTTLLVSPYQKHELIVQMAEEAAREFDIPFYYEDFREGYQRGVDISLELELYRSRTAAACSASATPVMKKAASEAGLMLFEKGAAS